MFELDFGNFKLNRANVFQDTTYDHKVNLDIDSQLGVTSGAQFSFDLNALYENLPDIQGKEFKLIVNGEQKGIFIADKPTRRDINTVTVKSYDRMIYFDKIVDSWLEDLSFPIFLYDFLKQLCKECGVELANASILNGGYAIEAMPAVSNATGRQILFWIGELAASFAVINSDGMLDLRWYKKKPITISSIYDLDQAEYSTDKIERLQISSWTETISVPAGISQQNLYIIQDNPLVAVADSRTLESIGRSIYDVIKDMSYVPFKLSAISQIDKIMHLYDKNGYALRDKNNRELVIGSGDRKLDISVGDIITVKPRKGSEFQAYIMSLTAKGTTFHEYDISATGNKTRDTKSPDKFSLQVFKLKESIAEAKIERGLFDVRLAETEKDLSFAKTGIGENKESIANLKLSFDEFSVDLSDYYTKNELGGEVDEDGNIIPGGIISSSSLAALKMAKDSFGVTLQDYYSKKEMPGVIDSATVETRNRIAQLEINFNEFNVTLQDYSTTTQMNNAINASFETTKEAIADMQLSIENGFKVYLAENYYTLEQFNTDITKAKSEISAAVILELGEFSVNLEDVENLLSAVTGDFKLIEEKLSAEIDLKYNAFNVNLSSLRNELFGETNIYLYDSLGKPLLDKNNKHLYHVAPGLEKRLDSKIADLTLDFEKFSIDLSQNYYTRNDIGGILTETEKNLTSSFEAGLNGLGYTLTQYKKETTELINTTETTLRADLELTPDRFSAWISKDESFQSLSNDMYLKTGKVGKLELSLDNFNVSLYGEEGTFNDPKKGSIVYEYRSSIELAEGRFMVELYGKDGTSDNVKGGIVKDYRSSIELAEKSFRVELYGKEGTEEGTFNDPKKGSIVYEYRSSIEATDRNFRVELYGEDGEGGIRQSILELADKNFRVELYGSEDGSFEDEPTGGMYNSILELTDKNFKVELYGKDGNFDEPKEGSLLQLTRNEFKVELYGKDGTGGIVSQLTITPETFNSRVGSSYNFTQLRQTVYSIDLTGVVRFLSGTTTYPTGSGTNITTINAGNITTGYVSADRIESGSISSAKLKITDGFITNAMIQDATIQSAKIYSIDAAKITVGTLSADRIATGSISSSKLNITTGFITTAMIADANITNAKIGNLAVKDAQINDINATKIIAGYISADRIQANSISSTKLNIANGFITNAMIQDATIQSAKIVSISADKITAGTVDASKVTVTNLQINNVFYGTYPIITASGTSGNPTVSLGNRQLGSTYAPNILNIDGTTVSLQGTSLVEIFTSAQSSKLNMTAGGTYSVLTLRSNDNTRIYSGSRLQLSSGVALTQETPSYYVELYITGSSMDFYPSTSGFNLGTSSRFWTNGYITNVYSTDIRAGTSSRGIVINSSGSNLELSPNSTSHTFNLGSSSYPWTNGYITNLQHRAGLLGFFGTAAKTKTTVSNIASTNATLAQLNTALYNLIYVLNGYGIV